MKEDWWVEVDIDKISEEIDVLAEEISNLREKILKTNISTVIKVENE